MHPTKPQATTHRVNLPLDVVLLIIQACDIDALIRLAATSDLLAALVRPQLAELSVAPTCPLAILSYRALCASPDPIRFRGRGRSEDRARPSGEGSPPATIANTKGKALSSRRGHARTRTRTRAQMHTQTSPSPLEVHTLSGRFQICRQAVEGKLVVTDEAALGSSVLAVPWQRHYAHRCVCEDCSSLFLDERRAKLLSIRKCSLEWDCYIHGVEVTDLRRPSKPSFHFDFADPAVEAMRLPAELDDPFSCEYAYNFHSGALVVFRRPGPFVEHAAHALQHLRIANANTATKSVSSQDIASLAVTTRTREAPSRHRQGALAIFSVDDLLPQHKAMPSLVLSGLRQYFMVKDGPWLGVLSSTYIPGCSLPCARGYSFLHEDAAPRRHKKKAQSCFLPLSRSEPACSTLQLEQQQQQQQQGDAAASPTCPTWYYQVYDLQSMRPLAIEDAELDVGGRARRAKAAEYSFNLTSLTDFEERCLLELTYRGRTWRTRWRRAEAEAEAEQQQQQASKDGAQELRLVGGSSRARKGAASVERAVADGRSELSTAASAGR